MILHSVRVENYRGLRGPLEVEFDTNATNLVEGPNGAGKSTLLDAILCALAENHNTAGAAAVEMRPRETALTPGVAVVFEHEGDVYRIAKTFLDSPKALLERKRPDGTFEAVAKGKAADEKVREMLRGETAKSRDERPGILKILFSAQSKQELPALSGNVLTDIREMLGTQFSGRQGASLEKSLKKKHDGLWTPGGKPKKGKLAEIDTELEKAREELHECEEVMSQVAGHEAAALKQRGQAAETLERLAAARDQHAALAPVAQRVSELLAQRGPASSRQEAAKAREELWRAGIDRIGEAAAAKRECEEKRPALEEAEACARTALEAANAAGALSRQAWQTGSQPDGKVEAAEARVGCASEFLRMTRELAALQQRLQRARGADAGRHAVDRQMRDLNAPDAEEWAAIEAAARALEKAAVHVQALELRLEIAAECELPAHVIAGDPAGEQRLAPGRLFTARGDGRLEVRLPGIATLTVSGPAGDAALWRAQERENRNLLEGLLAPFGVREWTGLAGRVQQRGALAAECIGLAAAYEAALGGDTLAGIEDRERDLNAARQEIVASEAAWGAEPPQVEALRDQAAKMRSAWERRRSTAEGEWQGAENRRTEAERAATHATISREANGRALDEARRELATLEADGKSMDERKEELNNRRRALESAAESVQQIESALAGLPSDAPERLHELSARIAELEKDAQSGREAYQQDEAAARALLAGGPYTSKAVAEERVRQLEADREIEMRKLDSIRLLKTAIDRAKARALAGIAEPVERRATAILERIMGRPFARVQLGEAMALQAVRPDGCRESANIDCLSAGEQEQIYFATRLALAEVLAGPRRQVLVLDDPLVNTDAERLPRILELIREKSDRLQFIILSCHPERYLELAGIAAHHLDAAEVTA